MLLQLDGRARALLRRLPRTTVYSSLELLLLVVLAVQCARLMWTIVTPVDPIGGWRPTTPGYFGSAEDILHGFDPFFRSSGGDAPTAVTTLQLALFGTRLDSATGRGAAIIAGPDGVQRSISVGEEIASGVRLKSVAFDHITLDRGGAEEDLFIDQSGGAGSVPGPGAATGLNLGGDPTSGSGSDPMPSPSAPRRDGASFAKLRSDIGFIPRIDGGRITGLTVRPQGSGEAFRQSGMREGDVVTAIGGQAITGQGDLDRIAGQYVNGGTLNVTVERGTATLSIPITIAGPMKKLILTSLLAALLAVPVLAQTTLNVRDADIRAFIADAAKVTGRTFIIDSRVQGKVTVVTDRPLSRSEYFEVFLSTLRANGLIAVPTSGGAFRVQPIDNAASQPGRIGTRGAAANSLVTEIVRLRAIDAQSAVDTVRPLVSAQGSVTANKAGNSLVIVDFADNIRRVREVLRRIDTDNDATRVITLKNAGAKEIATALQGLIGGGQGGQGGAATGPSVSIVPITSSNAVALSGDPSTVARLATVARDLDTRASNGTQIKVVFLENADAEQLLPVLQQLVGQAPSPVATPQLSSSSSGSTFGGASNSGSRQFRRGFDQ